MISEIKISKSKKAYYLRTYDLSYKEEIFLINQKTITFNITIWGRFKHDL